MAVTRAVAEAWQRDTGRPLLEGYGLSETSPVVAATPVACEAFMGHVGPPLEGTEIQILTEDGHDAASGEVGEIAVRGPQVMRGYWGRPQETRAAFTSEGFFKTGDLGCLLADGSLQIVDRKKDMIIVSGFNVYSAEVERQINLHPHVLESAVIGLPDPMTGERVVAYLVPREALTSDELDQHCRERLAAYKCPKAFVMVESLPKSAVGKILKRELRPSSSQLADGDPLASLPQIDTPKADISQ
jgi:Acyl-CoA synthetases (AMP-forming)/AMP-acid ligases II